MVKDNLLNGLLLDAGYMPFKNDGLTREYANDEFYQKKIVDTIGVKYFINIYLYGDSYASLLRYPPKAEADVCLMPEEEQENEHPTIWVSISFISIENVERTMEAIWEASGKYYYSREEQ